MVNSIAIIVLFVIVGVVALALHKHTKNSVVHRAVLNPPRTPLPSAPGSSGGPNEPHVEQK